jgi:hypothetical protein
MYKKVTNRKMRLTFKSRSVAAGLGQNRNGLQLYTKDFWVKVFQKWNAVMVA